MSESITRRTLLQAGGGRGRRAAALGAAPRRWPSARRARRHGRRVAVLGGGMAGLAAAHELVERGFEVDVYERKALGGKARSIPVAGHRGRRAPRRCPASTASASSPASTTTCRTRCGASRSPANANGVWDNLIDASGGEVAARRAAARTAPCSASAPTRSEARTPDGMRRILLDDARAATASRRTSSPTSSSALMVFLTSCDERRFGQWEHVSWWDFIKAEGKSEEYQKVLAARPDARLVAAKETVASTRTIGNMGEAFVYNIMGRGNDGAPDRVLNAPTNEAWIDPWVDATCASSACASTSGTTVEALDVAARPHRRARACATAAAAAAAIEADWFVSRDARRARAPAAGRRDVLALDPSLDGDATSCSSTG